MIPILLLLLAAPAGAAEEPSGCVNHVGGGGFEGGSPNPHWTESSSNSLKIICSPGTCGTGNGSAGPRSGIWWAWLGGTSLPEEASLTQTVTIPPGTANLRFFLWIGASSGNGQDTLSAQLDGISYFTVLEGDPAYTGGYAGVDLDVTDKADGATHTLKLMATNVGGGVTNYSVDDVSLVVCPAPVPTVSIGDVTVAEGDTGSTIAAFIASLSEPTPVVVSVSYTTGPPASGPAATAGADYTTVSGTLTFAAGALTQSVTVPVLGDTLDEDDESFALNLSEPINATLGDGTGLGTITDNDPLPGVSIADAAIAEGDSGSSNGTVSVSVSPVSGRAVTVSFATADGTAVAGTDYTAASGTLTIPAGASTMALTVAALGDAQDEVDETFIVDLTGPMNAVLADSQAQVTITDDDGPALSIHDGSVVEGDAGTVDASFAVTLSGTTVQTVSVDYGTSDGTATAGADYTAVSGTLTFAPGATSGTLTVAVHGDTLDEADEIFHVVLLGAVGASLADAVGIGKILDDDGGAVALAGELVHGTLRFEDLAALPGPVADRDIHLLERPPRTSFEVVVDAASGDVGAGNGPLLQRLAPDLSTVLQDSQPLGSGSARSLRMENALAVPVTDYIQVRSAGCDTDCDAADVYRIRAFDTTLSLPRFNEGAGQSTVLVLDNPTAASVTGNIWFWDGEGNLLASSPFTLAGNRSLVLGLATVLGIAGQTGTITVSHNGGYGSLTGKTVSVESSTGFTFDTPLQARPR